ncbi:hypothetical protein FVB9288_01706 [Flavobacterium sp. CECT 9288]|uniref:hypothetical protein n=1 Tax=Flavobacterium sp. CECT 9288 TaxID=2845819 RepID=UPI001E318116|nr:hypothetical protein [Flavobacterium sp. CECT 9288]CAH0336034.1 hypothetical protein FVB9288_01706 [Flavobacterium sp. CECT 9288]
MDFFKKSKTNLFDFVKEPSLPWTNRVVISAAGVIASGWTLDSKVFLFSSDEYSISDPITGQREIRNYDEDNSAMTKFSKDNLEFNIDELGQTIKIFGLRGGDGNHCTTDFWNLDSFSPSLGEQIIGIQNIKTRQNQTEYWKEFELISLINLEYTTLKFGFSPNEKHFGIFGSGGAEIFTRQ